MEKEKKSNMSPGKNCCYFDAHDKNTEPTRVVKNILCTQQYGNEFVSREIFLSFCSNFYPMHKNTC